jgi:hypothetical protein
MMSTLSATESVSNVGAAATYGGGAVSAGIQVAEKYEIGGFLYWVDHNSLIITIGIMLAGVLIQGASAIFASIIRYRSAKYRADSK